MNFFSRKQPPRSFTFFLPEGAEVTDAQIHHAAKAAQDALGLVQMVNEFGEKTGYIATRGPRVTKKGRSLAWVYTETHGPEKKRLARRNTKVRRSGVKKS